MTFSLIRGDATSIPLADDSVDLIVTSPPYFALRSYTDQCPDCGGSGSVRPASHGFKVCPECGKTANRKRCNDCGVSMQWPKADAVEATCITCDGKGGHHYAGQIGSEATPQAFLEALWVWTAECRRVLKPSGSLWVNLGDKYSATGPSGPQGTTGARATRRQAKTYGSGQRVDNAGIPAKSLMGLPWRYAIGCIDQLGLILRAEVIWSKPNGLPESVTDRVRRSHEQWFHMTKEPRYFSAVDEVREVYAAPTATRTFGNVDPSRGDHGKPAARMDAADVMNPLGKLPGSVWTVPTEPLRVPDHIGVDHFAAFPSEWPRRIILGWSPSGVCVACGEGRRPVVAKEVVGGVPFAGRDYKRLANGATGGPERATIAGSTEATITGYACACTTPDAPTRPAVVLDPFCGTGTTPAVAHALGRHGIGIDLSADYLRLADWRCNDPALRAKVLRVDKPPAPITGQQDLFGGDAA